MSLTYPYEQLDGARFQRLVQALLASEFPGLQCLPLSGPDGGRDAIQAVTDGDSIVDANIFQVKFRESSPLGEPRAESLYTWLAGKLTQEIPGLKALKERGVRSYFVATNIKGTGNLDVGLRDKMVAWAAKHLPLPTTFWWRDDLDTRLSGRFDLVFHYGLFAGPDSLRVILEHVFNIAHPSESRVRMSSLEQPVLALMAYLADQHRTESRLRFEQANVQSPLLDLFTDVRILHPESQDKIDSVNRWINEARVNKSAPGWEADGFDQEGFGVHYDPSRSRAGYLRRAYRSTVGAAELLLCESAPKSCSRVVIEAAPGQGKSTLGQYVSQVHRIRLLDVEGDLSKLPEKHRTAPVRLPIRIEFRYIAAWFAGRNPWTSTLVEKADPANHWAQSVESYIAAHVRHATGGASFTPDDVISVLSQMPSFIFFDGLDEIPDLDLRGQVVEAAEATISRLDYLRADTQILVTSRPSVFLKSPGFSESEFVHLQLATLSRDLILQFAQSWMSSQDVSDDQRSEIEEVLEANLTQSHVAELARSPMQLAILLWLISTKGRALPEQRTALYESYLEKYLDRESIRDPVVRANRPILLALHGYIGWLLHSRAESKDFEYESGDITQDELTTLFREYLIHEDRPTDLVDKLFQGTERFFLLVSRIEGKYEFEVQTIREFFAARYLYKEAPRSTSAERVNGARPDRLQELIRNPYWTNVARFFCGYYDKGELADLTRRLRDLCDDANYSNLMYPRLLIASILQDRSSAESRRDTRDLIMAMTDDVGLRLLTSSGAYVQRDDSTLFSTDGGLDFFVDRLYNAFNRAKTREQVIDFGGILVSNEPDDNRVRRWLELEKTDMKREEWMLRGIYLDAIENVQLSEALRIFDPQVCGRLDWIRCVEAGRIDVAYHDQNRFEALRSVLGDGYSPLRFAFSNRTSASALFNNASLIRFFGPRRSLVLDGGEWESSFSSVSPGPGMERAVASLEGAFMAIATAASEPGAKHFFAVMTEIAAILQGVFGAAWIAWRLALLAATTPGIEVKGGEVTFREPGSSLALAARRARLSSSQKSYWIEATRATPDSHGCRMATAAALFAWAEPEILCEVAPFVADWWESLTAWEISDLFDVVGVLLEFSGVGRSAPRRVRENALPVFRRLPVSLCGILLQRADDKLHHSVMQMLKRRFASDSSFFSGPHGTVAANLLLSDLLDNWSTSIDWRTRLGHIRTLYGATTGVGYGHAGTDVGVRLPERTALAVAREVLFSPMDYPKALLRYANRISESKVTRGLRPLRDVAAEQQWFNDLAH